MLRNKENSCWPAFPSASIAPPFISFQCNCTQFLLAKRVESTRNVFRSQCLIQLDGDAVAIIKSKQ